MPEILESHLATDLAWFPINALPEPFIPHHKMAINAISTGKIFQEIDITPDTFYE